MWFKEVAGRLYIRFPFDMAFLNTELTDWILRQEQILDKNLTVLDNPGVTAVIKNYYGVVRSPEIQSNFGGLDVTADTERWYLEQYVFSSGYALYGDPRPSLYPIKVQKIMLGTMPFELTGATCNNLGDVVSMLNTEIGPLGYTASISGGQLRIDFPSNSRIFFFPLHVNYRTIILEDFVGDPTIFGWILDAPLVWNSINESIEHPTGVGTAKFHTNLTGYNFVSVLDYTMTPGRKYRITFTMSTAGAGFTCQVKVGGNAGPLHTITGATTTFTDEIVCGTGTLEVSFEIGNAIGEIQLVDIYEKKDGFWKLVNYFLDYGASRVPMSEVKELKITKCECKNPIYLKWIGPLGGWNYWLFERTQFVIDNAASTGEFGIYSDDISTQQSDSDYLGKEAYEAWTVGTEAVNDDEWKGLETLFNSPTVMVLVNPDTWKIDARDPSVEVPPQWLVVKVEPGKTPVKQTKHHKHFFECVLRFPKFNIQWA
jgi:hypothetical protein